MLGAMVSVLCVTQADLPFWLSFYLSGDSGGKRTTPTNECFAGKVEEEIFVVLDRSGDDSKTTREALPCTKKEFETRTEREPKERTSGKRWRRTSAVERGGLLLRRRVRKEQRLAKLRHGRPIG